MTWHSLCRPKWPRTHRDLAASLFNRVKGVHHCLRVHYILVRQDSRMNMWKRTDTAVGVLCCLPVCMKPMCCLTMSCPSLADGLYLPREWHFVFMLFPFENCEVCALAEQPQHPWVLSPFSVLNVGNVVRASHTNCPLLHVKVAERVNYMVQVLGDLWNLEKWVA